jgi:cytosine/adenosine deaminase-related metal-dependent hydrolase
MGLAPTEVVATPFEQSCREIRLGRELGAHRISCHVSMGAYDNGLEFVRQLGEAGLLAPDLLFVHGSSLTDDELAMIARSGAAISSTPETELQMAMGHPVVARAQAAGARPSLGIDIVSNYSGDMFARMRLLLQAQRGLEKCEARQEPPLLLR